MGRSHQQQHHQRVRVGVAIDRHGHRGEREHQRGQQRDVLARPPPHRAMQQHHRSHPFQNLGQQQRPTVIAEDRDRAHHRPQRHRRLVYGHHTQRVKRAEHEVGQVRRHRLHRSRVIRIPPPPRTDPPPIQPPRHPTDHAQHHPGAHRIERAQRGKTWLDNPAEPARCGCVGGHEGKIQVRRRRKRAVVPRVEAVSRTAISSQREGWGARACNASRAPEVSA